MTETGLLIVGAGAAGLECAAEALRAGVRSVLLTDTEKEVGGVLTQCLHSGFGLGRYGRDMTGLEMLASLRAALPDAVTLRTETTVLQVFPDRTALLVSPEGMETVRFRQLVLAVGCRERSLWSLPVAGARPAGVFTAGLAQRLLNREGVSLGKRIVILGSGNVGLVMAGRFAELGTPPLAIIEKRPQLGGLTRNQNRFVRRNGIPVRLNATVTALHGDGQLTGVTVRDLLTGNEELLPCDTLVTALGLIPEQSLADALRVGGRLPDWVQLTGNCDFVHDIADAVLRDADGAARRAAAALAAES